MTLPRLLALVLALPIATALAAGSARIAELRASLSTEDPEALKAMAISLVSQNEQDPALLDLVADRIAQGQATQDAELADALAWLCRPFANARAGRYKQFLDKVSDTAGTVRLRSYAALVSVNLPDPSGPSYRPPGANAAPKPAADPVAPPPRAAAPVVVPVPAPSLAAAVAVSPAVTVSPAPAPKAAPVSAPLQAVAGGSYRLRPGAQLRTRPLGSGPALGVDPGAFKLTSSARNAEGTWWFAKGERASGWVREADLAPP